MDTNSIVSAIIQADSGPLDSMEAEQTTIQSKESAITALQTQLTALQTAANALKSASGDESTTAASTNEAVVTATTSSGAAEGTHTLVVNQSAQAERMIQNTGVSSSTATVGTGAFSYTYNGVTRTVQTSSTSTLQNLADLINNDSGNPGVTASVINDGTNYYLSLSGNSTGTAYGITINDAATTISGFQTADFTVIQQAQDAEVQLDNWPSTSSGDWIERSSNSISDLVPGLTLNLQGTGSATITLSRDTSTLTTNLNSFVTAYNAMVSSLQTYTGYNATAQTGGIFQGDPLGTMLDGIANDLAVPPAGFDTTDDSVTLPAQIGLAHGQERQPEPGDDGQSDHQRPRRLDRRKHGRLRRDAISNNYAAVLSMLGAQGSGDTNSQYITFDGATRPPPPPAPTRCR